MIDRVEIYVGAGDGGDGVVSFRHEKYVPFGGPDGGDGGNGGSVSLVADGNMSTLRQFWRRRHFRAERGEKGAGKRMHGKSGGDLVIRVPLGTVVSRKEGSGEKVTLADLTEEGQQGRVAKGGHGGFGNSHFATSTNQQPRIAQKGEKGTESTLVLDLKLIADVGIIGRPNAGKSTLLASASAARPEIAGYPFTTREPVLGVVDVGNRSFVLAEVPGLIDGAHRGSGLGHDFLRHAERTKVLIHLLDGTSESPVDDMRNVNEELSLFSSELREKAQIVVPMLPPAFQL
jgi:GTP-binding protein